MKKVFLLPLLSVLALFSCGNNPNVDPTHDILSEYTSRTVYNLTGIKSKEETITWLNHHIIKEEGTIFKSGQPNGTYINTYQYEGNDLIKETTTSTSASGMITYNSTINTYNEHHDLISKVMYKDIKEDDPTPPCWDYEYTYDKANNITYKKESTDGIGRGEYDTVITTNNTYDNLSRLTKCEIKYYDYGDDTPKESKTTSYTYQGNFKNFITLDEEKIDQDGDVITANITNELDNRGNIIKSIGDINSASAHTKQLMIITYDNNNVEKSHQTYDLLTEDDYNLITDYVINYHNNNYAQIELEITYYPLKSRTEIVHNRYDTRNRLISSYQSSKNAGLFLYGYSD